MKPSSKNEVMNGIVNAYIAQKVMDKTNNTHYADTWKILNGADDEIDASLKFDLSEVEWSDVKAHLKANNIAFTLCLISYKDGHSQNSFVWYDNEHIYATEMNEMGSVVFHVIDNANKEIIKPTDETSSSILKMLLALENGGANGGGETTTKQVFKGGVDILDKPLDVKSKATFGRDVNVNGNLIVNSATNIKDKSLTSADAGKVLTVNEDGSLSWQQKGAGGGMKAFFDAGGKCAYSTATSFDGIIPFGATSNVRDMSIMFQYSDLISVPLFDTSNVIDMHEMFYQCGKLTNVPLFDTSNVNNMSNMFYYCINLTSIPLFDTNKVTRMSGMFESCKKLISVPLFDTSNVIDMHGMFYQCQNLASVPAFNTSKVTDMRMMFYFCLSLTSVPAFDVSNVTNMTSMFYACTNIEAIHIINISADFDVHSCTKLTREALLEIIGNLKTVTSTKTLTMGTTNLAKLTEEDKAIATNKGWTLA